MVSSDGTTKLKATAWKVEPHSRTITIKLSAWAAPLLCVLFSHWHPVIVNSQFLWGPAHDPSIFLPHLWVVFSQYLSTFDSAVHPHDCCSFTASAWRLGGLNLDAIMILGGWRSLQVLKETNFNVALLLLPHALLYFTPVGCSERTPPPLLAETADHKPPTTLGPILLAPKGIVFYLLPVS